MVVKRIYGRLFGFVTYLLYMYVSDHLRLRYTRTYTRRARAQACAIVDRRWRQTICPSPSYGHIPQSVPTATTYNSIKPHTQTHSEDTDLRGTNAFGFVQLCIDCSDLN